MSAASIHHSPGTSYAAPLRGLVEKVRAMKTESGLIDVKKLPEFMDSLPFYATYNLDISTAINQFVSNSIHDASLTIQKLQSSGGTKGASGASVFLVKDMHSKLIAVAKALPRPQELPEEIAALDKLEELHLTEGDHVSLMAVGKTTVRENEYGLVLQTGAAGKGIDDLIEDVGQAPSPRRRERHTRSLSKALIKTAHAQAELHTRSISKSPHPAQVRKNIGATKEILLEVQQAELKLLDIDSQKLTNFVHWLCDRFQANPGQGVIAHLDAHAGNYFYDADSEKVTFIDLATMNDSFNPAGEGQSCAARDSQFFLMKMRECASLKGIPLEQSIELERLFINAYKEREGSVASHESEEFFAFRFYLGTLHKYRLVLNSLSPEDPICLICKEIVSRMRAAIDSYKPI